MKEAILPVPDNFFENSKAAELIRCKDCMYFEQRSIYDHGLCHIHCNGVGESEVVNETYYCNYAERREEC